jgi:hypothetical protein
LAESTSPPPSASVSIKNSRKHGYLYRFGNRTVEIALRLNGDSKTDIVRVARAVCALRSLRHPILSFSQRLRRLDTKNTFIEVRLYHSFFVVYHSFKALSIELPQFINKIPAFLRKKGSGTEAINRDGSK